MYSKNELLKIDFLNICIPLKEIFVYKYRDKYKYEYGYTYR